MKSIKYEPTVETYEEIIFNEILIKRGDEVYYARIIPQVGVCYVQNLRVRTIYVDSFVGVDTVTKNAQFLSGKCVGKTVFTKRNEAQKVVKEVQKSGSIKTFNSIEREDCE